MQKKVSSIAANANRTNALRELAKKWNFTSPEKNTSSPYAKYGRQGACNCRVNIHESRIA